jgi:hypothetical protein
MGDSPTIMAAHEDVGNDAQPSIEAMEDAHESPGVDEEDELSVDQIRVSRKVNLIATIEALRLKPSSLSRMMVPLCRMVAMLIVRPTWLHLKLIFFMVTGKGRLCSTCPPPMRVAWLRR